MDMLQIQKSLEELAVQQKINNFLIIAGSNSPYVTEEVKAEAYNKAIQLMGLQKSKAAEQFNSEALPNNIVR